VVQALAVTRVGRTLSVATRRAMALTILTIIAEDVKLRVARDGTFS